MVAQRTEDHGVGQSDPPPVPPRPPMDRVIKGFDPFGIAQRRLDREQAEEMRQWERDMAAYRRHYAEWEFRRDVRRAIR